MNPSVEKVAQAIQCKAKNRDRLLVAIAGPPGAGKSTFAESLHEACMAKGLRTAVVPMDGFHLDNAILDARGLRERKGAPFTFDAPGLLHLLTRLHAREAETFIPVFDRERDLTIAGARTVVRDDTVIIVEGNYLLLDDAPWSRIQELFDLTVFIDPGMDVLRSRLVGRWLAHGHTAEQALQRATENDLPNAQYVVDHSAIADIVLNGPAAA